MADELLDVQPSEVEFLEELKVGEGNVVFKTRIRSKECVMKVFCGQRGCSLDPALEPILFIRERNAYRLLAEKGLCERGVVPRFYGTIENINVNLWPYLQDEYGFEDDELPPNAVLVEYVPHVAQLDLTNFSQDRLDRLRMILFEFHDIGLFHGDPFPRNMMVAASSSDDRVLWIGFDRAQLLTRSKCSPRHARRIDLEIELMNDFAKRLAEDAKNGDIKASWSYYYEYQ